MITCKLKECSTRLSQYNKNDYCFAHVKSGYVLENDSEVDTLHAKRLKTSRWIRRLKGNPSLCENCGTT